jgi:anti-sigma regulatory factor (Ser/Thr protein kinase)
VRNFDERQWGKFSERRQPDATAERGRGLAMAKTVLDQLAYRCDDQGNQWTLISQRFG